MNHAAQQLPLTLSVVDTATILEERDRADAYAQQAHEQLAALEAAQAKLRAENAQLRQTVAVLRAELRGKFEEIMRTPLGPARPGTADLTTLLKLCHPDRWQGQAAEVLAHEVTVVINQLRQGKGVGA